MWLWLFVATLAGAGAPAQALSSGRVATFQFGTPTSATHAGFTRGNVIFPGIDEPSLTIMTPLDEYYVGESIPWTVSAASASGEISVSLSAGAGLVAEQTHQAAGSLRGAFESRGLPSGIYTLQAGTVAPQGRQTAPQQIILAPDPWGEQ